MCKPENYKLQIIQKSPTYTIPQPINTKLIRLYPAKSNHIGNLFHVKSKLLNSNYNPQIHESGTHRSVDFKSLNSKPEDETLSSWKLILYYICL